MWLSCDCHVTVMWLSCDCHVTRVTGILACDSCLVYCYVTVMWLVYCHVTVMWLVYCHVTVMCLVYCCVTVMWLSCVWYTVMWLSCKFGVISEFIFRGFPATVHVHIVVLCKITALIALSCWTSDPDPILKPTRLRPRPKTNSNTDYFQHLPDRFPAHYTGKMRSGNKSKLVLMVHTCYIAFLEILFKNSNPIGQYIIPIVCTYALLP